MMARDIDNGRVRNRGYSGGANRLIPAFRLGLYSLALSLAVRLLSSLPGLASLLAILFPLSLRAPLAT